MKNHKYHVGQTVSLAQSPLAGAAPGPYEIVRLLPAERAEFTYRIKSRQELHERIVGESRLSAIRGL